MPSTTAAIVSAAATAVPAPVARTGDGRVLCSTCLVADSVRTRMRGLLGRSGMEPGEGLLITPTNAIHMWFMRFAIDAVFLDREGRVLRIAADLGPWKLASQRGARSVLELPAGAAAEHGLAVGHLVQLADPAAER